MSNSTLSVLSVLSVILTLPSQAVVFVGDTSVTAVLPSDELGTNTYVFDVNSDGRTDWSIQSTLSRFGSNGVNVIAEPTTGLIYQTLSPNDFARVVPLDAGTLIGGSLDNPVYSWYYGFGPPLSEWANNQAFGSFYLQKGYLGFEFESDEGTHYGYAYLESLGTGSMRISQVAWETEPGKAIRAGNIPEPSSSLLLSLSICMALAQRRRI
jgi:hypothetical protein